MPDFKRLGFVDHVLDNFHAKTFLSAFRNELAGRGYTVTGCTATSAEDGRAWADHHQVPYFASVADMNAHVDAYVVLAPSNPEVHWQQCQQVLPMGKPTFVDKTFAPDWTTAQQIFNLADRHDVPIQTSSALRYTSAQGFVREHGPVQHMIAWGGGRSFMEYAIHPVELVISCMGADVQSLMRRGADQFSQLLMNFAGGRTAVANVYVGHRTGFAASLTTAEQTAYLPVDNPTLFLEAAAGILDFFDAGRPLVPRTETLAVRRILDLAGEAATLHRFVEL